MRGVSTRPLPAPALTTPSPSSLPPFFPFLPLPCLPPSLSLCDAAALPWTVNLGTTFSYVAVALVSLFGGPIVSKLGLRNTLILGAMTFPINGSAYYVNSRYGTQWYLIVGRTICESSCLVAGAASRHRAAR